MRTLPTLVLIALVVVLAGCAQPASPGRHFLAKYGVPRPALERVPVCWGYGCREQPEIDMTFAWSMIEVSFAEPPPDARSERERVASAVASWEAAAAAAAPIGNDRGGTFEGIGEAGQLDCVDETVNTTRLLVLLEDARLLRFHAVEAPATRGAFLAGWPHTSAVLREKTSGARYAIDSWFHDNGIAAEVVPIESWLAGWAPGEP